MNQPKVQLYVGSKQQVAGLYAIAEDANVIRRFLRGQRMCTVESTLDEFAAALQFPWYFGRNKDAFDECITDLSWLEPFNTLVIMVFDGDRMLIDETRERAWFIQAMSDAMQHFEDAGRGRVTVILQVLTTAEQWRSVLPAIRG